MQEQYGIADLRVALSVSADLTCWCPVLLAYKVVGLSRVAGDVHPAGFKAQTVQVQTGAVLNGRSIGTTLPPTRGSSNASF